MKPLNVVFMGSPEVALPSLKALLGMPAIKVVGVVSQPDKAAGRGQASTPPPVAQFAQDRRLPLFQPPSLRNNAEVITTLKSLSPDLIVIVAYGKILPPEILKLPPRGCVNVHFSLLPKYRGAAPIQWALIHDETETGVTTFILNERVDAGPILLQRKVAIHDEDTAEILGHRLSIVGAQLLTETIEKMINEELSPLPQSDRIATDAPLLKKEDGQINWTQKARRISCQIRGLTPWPGTFTHLNGKLLKIHHAELVTPKKQGQPGEVLVAESEELEVACGQGALLIRELQLEGKRKMEISEFLRGHHLVVGQKLG